MADCIHAISRIQPLILLLAAASRTRVNTPPLEFLSFRARLEAASGFQSDQFRQIEFVLGAKSEGALARFPERSRPREALTRRYHASTVWDAFLRYLSREGYAVPPPLLARDVTVPPQPSPEVQQILVDIYRRDPKNAELCERLVDLDEGLQEWRYRHVKMVERTIGMKPGSGGSSGAAYLATTVGKPLFPDLWEIRAHL